MRDPGILPRPSVARRLDRELFLLLAGPAALLLQVAHPLVAAGVADHSSFARDPVGRLHRTLDTTLAVIFGDSQSARRALARIDGRHASVRGVAIDGRRYDARDPRLLLWVQCTLVMTSLRLYELVAGPLSSSQREAYWAESAPIARALGIPDELLPRTIDELARYERDALRDEVHPDEVSRRVGRAVLRPFPALPAAAYWPMDAFTAGLLPPRLRRVFGLRFATPERVLFRAAIVSVRGLRTILPSWLTAVPQARRWEARFGRDHGSTD
jgi:uncharacterized protein (DUF2236 family)